ncbi:acylneuraminate cytidylyltransferase, partial [Bacteroides uniformis]
MKKQIIHRWMLMAVFCLGASLIGINAQEKDWANLQRYAQQNAGLPKPDKNEKRVVFMGNSITEGWVNTHPDFFKSNGYIGRGIGGQTSYQFLVRFREDVINLSPALVVINAATNDIAENTGAYHEDRTFGNIVSMVELAKANHIKVILTTTLPAAAFGWNPAIKDAPQKIASLNARLKAYAQTNKIPFVDYYSSMVSGSNKALNPAYTKDGVHPTSEGYDVMENLIQQAIN